jgi:hypothetical protein
MAIIIIVITIIGLMVFLGSLSLPTNAQNVLKTIGSPGSGNGQLDDPKGVVVDTMSSTLVIIVSKNSILMANLLEHGAPSAQVMGNSMAH